MHAPIPERLTSVSVKVLFLVDQRYATNAQTCRTWSNGTRNGKFFRRLFSKGIWSLIETDNECVPWCWTTCNRRCVRRTTAKKLINA